MKGHFGAILTSSLAGIALALVLLQALVTFHTANRHGVVAADVAASQSNRYSIPGGRSGIPWLPFDHLPPAPPANPEGRSPQRQQEERRSPAPSHFRAPVPQPGPRPARKLTA